MNNIVITTSGVYLKAHTVYSVSLDYQTIPAQYRWCWRKFSSVVVNNKRNNTQLKICFCVYNLVTKKLENDSFKLNYDDEKLARETYKTIVEQLNKQDPAMRYVDAALEEALKGN